MKIDLQVAVDAPKEKVWEVITDIENSVNVLSGVQSLEILEKPDRGLVGLKWRETRKLFGQEATETMWVTDVKEHESYQVRAESHGSIYLSKLYVAEQDGGTLLGMTFGAKPQSFAAKLMSATMGFMFKGATKKALLQDLQDIKAAAEKN